MRCFLALSPPPEVKGRVGDLLGRLKPGARGVKWVALEQLHLTLRFFLSLGEPERTAIDGLLRPLCSRTPPFPLKVAGVGSFGPRGAVSTLWAGVSDPSGALSAFHRSLEAALDGVGFPPEPRPLSPHLTLGRLREPSRDPALLAKLEGEREFRGGGFDADRLRLISSVLTPAGPVYREEAEWPFGTSGS